MLVATPDGIFTVTHSPSRRCKILTSSVKGDLEAVATRHGVRFEVVPEESVYRAYLEPATWTELWSRIGGWLFYEDFEAAVQERSTAGRVKLVSGLMEAFRSAWRTIRDENRRVEYEKEMAKRQMPMFGEDK